MEIDASGWPDINNRLSGSTLSDAELELLVGHVTDRLVGHFGADVVECWLGKDGSRRHTMREVAAAAIAHLSPVLNAVPADTIGAAVDNGTLGTKTPPPWDDHWRTQPRTSSWRS